MVTNPTQIKRVIIVPLENKSRTTWIADPYIGKLASIFSDATNFFGFSGTSLPSYLMETSGSNQGITGDSFTFCQFKVANIYDILTANGLTYENFEEKTGSQGNHRHAPGYFYPSTCKGVQDFNTFISKYVNGTSVPGTYTWVTANFCNIGHNCPASTVSAWLKNTLKLDTILAKPWWTDGSTLLILVCDDGGNAGTPTLCLMMSTSSNTGIKSGVKYTHVNDLSTVMLVLGLAGSIGNASANIAMKDMFGGVGPIPLAVNLTINPTTITPGDQVTFAAAASGGTPGYTFSWTGLPPTCSQLGQSNPNIITCKPVIPGTYNVTVTVKDTANIVTTAQGRLIIISPPPPTGKFNVYDVVLDGTTTKRGVTTILDTTGTLTKDQACVEVCNRLGTISGNGNFNIFDVETPTPQLIKRGVTAMQNDSGKYTKANACIRICDKLGQL